MATPEERERWLAIRAKAEETLERLADLKVDDQPTNVVDFDPVLRWKLEADAQEERFARARREMSMREIETRLSGQLSNMLTDALLNQKDFLMAVVAEALGETWAEVRAENEKKLAELRAELNAEILDLRALIAETRKEISEHGGGNIAALPSFLPQRRA